jgi:hypothetical protein
MDGHVDQILELKHLKLRVPTLRWELVAE